MSEGWQIVFEADSRQACLDRSLVLQSLQIPCEVLADASRFAVIVPDALAEKARFELWQYEEENRPRRKPPAPAAVFNSAWGIAAYIGVISIVAIVAGGGILGRNWYLAGRVDGELIRDGEFWRAATALTLHSGLRHFLGNVGFGAFFGMLAGRALGPGVAWLAIVLAATAGNLLNTVLLAPDHRSIGASTAVFAALGLVAGYTWLGRINSDGSWAYRAGPLVGGIALLAFTGTGDANTDVGAHLAGFVCGLLAGTALIVARGQLASTALQRACGAGALAVVALAWMLALWR